MQAAQVAQAWMLRVPMGVLTHIVRLIADGGAESVKEAIKAIAGFSQASRLTHAATSQKSIFAYIMGLAPVRAFSNDKMLVYMRDRDFALGLARNALECPNTALMPRIVALARGTNGAVVSDALHARLVASLRSATVNDEPMYDPALASLESLATEIIRTLQADTFAKISEPISSAVKAFIALSMEDRKEHSRKYGPMCIWDVSGATDFSGACTRFTVDLDPPDPDGYTDAVITFNSDLYWDTSEATNMSSMFQENDEFKGDLSTWDVSKVERTDRMFLSSGIENSGVGRWDVRALVNAESMFQHARAIRPSLDLSGWNIGSCMNLRRMFHSSSATDNGIGAWKLHIDAKTHRMLVDTPFSDGLIAWSETHRNSARPSAIARFGTREAPKSAEPKSAEPKSAEPKSKEEKIRDVFAAALRDQRDGLCAVQ